jgi:Xaa-Pro aminopeptidase
MPVTLLHCHIDTLLSKHEVHMNSLAGPGCSVVDDLSSPIVTAKAMKNAAELAGMREAHGVSGPLLATHLVTTCMPF